MITKESEARQGKHNTSSVPSQPLAPAGERAAPGRPVAPAPPPVRRTPARRRPCVVPPPCIRRRRRRASHAKRGVAQRADPVGGFDEPRATRSRVQHGEEVVEVSGDDAEEIRDGILAHD